LYLSTENKGQNSGPRSLVSFKFGIHGTFLARNLHELQRLPVHTYYPYFILSVMEKCRTTGHEERKDRLFLALDQQPLPNSFFFVFEKT